MQYSVKFVSDQKWELKEAIDSLLIAFNNSLSTYIPDSEISIFNNKDSISFENDVYYNIQTSS